MICATNPHPDRLVDGLCDCLSPSDPICFSDLIFALAGRQSRKLSAPELFRQDKEHSILLSVRAF